MLSLRVCIGANAFSLRFEAALALFPQYVFSLVRTIHIDAGAPAVVHTYFFIDPKQPS